MLESSFHDPLSAQINASTRSHHVLLNRLISSRLPVCLPLNTSDPTLYTSGISQFADIFYAFEEVWDEATVSDVDLLSFLRTLRPHGLARSARIRKDLEYLRSLKNGAESGQGQQKSKAVEAFVTHIRSVVQANPHLLIAYAWTLYMAIFSGGRWIRGQLCSAGEDFWTSPSDTSPATTNSDDNEKPTLEELKLFEPLGLSFWFFPTDTDGEDIKVEFKRRLQDGEHLLTSAQREEIVKESQDVFDRFQDMVADLDATIGESLSTVKPPQQASAQAPAKKLFEDKANEYLFNMPGYAGLALVVSCVSWYAMYHAGTWA
jgi:heme oxygenase